MSQISGEIYQMMNAAGTENRFPRTVVEAVLGLSSYLQGQFASLADIYMPIEGITEKKTGQEFVYRQTPNTIKAKELTLDRIIGKTLAWNQEVTEMSAGAAQTVGYTASINSSGGLNISGTATSSIIYSELAVAGTEPWIRDGRKYLVLPNQPIPLSMTTFGINGYGAGISASFNNKGFIWSNNDGGQWGAGIALYSVEGTTINLTNLKFMRIDLTRMFGRGNEPATIDEFLALYPEYSPYNSGQLISNDTKQIETVGFNLWDEEWEVGYYDANGNKQYYSNTIRNAHPVPVLPNTTYYFHNVPTGSGHWDIHFYDSNMGHLSYITDYRTFTTPANCYYINFYEDCVGSVYNHDICINLSDTTKNGTYEPYTKSVLPLNLDSIKVVSPNVWDEQWVNGHLNENGVLVSGGTTIASKNFVPVEGGATYYIKAPTLCYVCFYDANQTFISSQNSLQNTTFTTPANCAYIKFNPWDGSGYYDSATYKNDLTVNLSSPAFNGRYFPHGILTIEGGLKSAGSVYDEIRGGKLYKRIERKRIANITGWDIYEGRFYSSIPGGKLTSGGVDNNSITSKYPRYVGDWFSCPDKAHTFGEAVQAANVPAITIHDSSCSTVAELLTANANTEFDYELANVEVYDLASPLPVSMPAGTTEERISPNADGLSAPFCADITYGMAIDNYAETAGVALNAISTQYAEATARLLNARTIWGQSFDGSANITGALSGVTNIDSLAYFDTTNGRIGIGTSSPSYNLHVSGTFKANGNSEIGGSLIVGSNLNVPYNAGLNFYGANDLWMASLGLNANADQLLVSLGVNNDHILLHDGNYTSYSPSLTQFNTSNGVLAEGIASNASRLDSLEDWLTDPRLTSLYSDSLSADTLNVIGNVTLGAVTATSLACAALSSVGNINSKIYFSGANVGIANSSPSYGLDVAGTFRATGNAVFGGTIDAINGRALLHSIQSDPVEIDTEVVPAVEVQPFQITDEGYATFMQVNTLGLLKLHSYYTEDHEFKHATMYYDYEENTIVSDTDITAPSFIQSSDAKLKTDLTPIALTIEQIASAPAVEFNWIGNGQRGAGSIAQYWENTLPYNVHHSGDTLTMEYGNIALISAITCAREIQRLEGRIKELEAKLNQ